MTVKQLAESSKVYVTAMDIAPILGADAQDIRNQAQLDPAKLGFPVIVMGSRVRIPRAPFLKYLGVDV